MAEHYKVQLGQTIRARREQLGLTQKDLAEATHYKEAQTVSRWERGENVPSNLDVVAEALKWTLAELVAGVEPPDKRTARKLGIVPDNGTPDLTATLRSEASPPDVDQLALIQERIEDLSEICGRILTLLEQDLTDRATAAARQALATEQKRARAAHRTRAA